MGKKKSTIESPTRKRDSIQGRSRTHPAYYGHDVTASTDERPQEATVLGQVGTGGVEEGRLATDLPKKYLKGEKPSYHGRFSKLSG